MRRADPGARNVVLDQVSPTHAGEDRPQAPLEPAAAMIPFAGTLGVDLQAAAPDEVVGRLRWRAS